MKTKVVDYNDIVSVHNGEEYYHGQIIYSDYKSSNGVYLLRLNIDMALCILPDEQENFLNDISELVTNARNKAIDDIVIKIKERVGMDWEWDFMFIEQIAEQLKAGVEND